MTFSVRFVHLMQKLLCAETTADSYVSNLPIKAIDFNHCKLCITGFN